MVDLWRVISWISRVEAEPVERRDESVGLVKINVNGLLGVVSEHLIGHPFVDPLVSTTN